MHLFLLVFVSACSAELGRSHYLQWETLGLRLNVSPPFRRAKTW